MQRDHRLRFYARQLDHYWAITQDPAVRADWAALDAAYADAGRAYELFRREQSRLAADYLRDLAAG